jgi:hypothetical protein
MIEEPCESDNAEPSLRLRGFAALYSLVSRRMFFNTL